MHRPRPGLSRLRRLTLAAIGALLMGALAVILVRHPSYAPVVGALATVICATAAVLTFVDVRRRAPALPAESDPALPPAHDPE